MAEASKSSSPTPFQRKALWTAVAFLSVVVIGAVGVFVIWVVTQVLAFLQPVLVPIAVAGIIAFLIEPLIGKLVNRGMNRTRAMLIVFVGFHLFIAGVIALVIPPAVRQAGEFASRGGPLLRNAHARVLEAFDWVDAQVGKYLPAPPGQKIRAAPAGDSIPTTDPPDDAGPAATAPAGEADAAKPAASSASAQVFEEWAISNAANLFASSRHFATRAFSGFLGAFGYLIGLFLVPVYLFYFLKESESITRQWSDYVPLRESSFRTEVVDTLTEINGYLVAFFRGQMLVGIIDGILVGTCLQIIGLPYGFLIGLLMAMLGLIPFIGPLICWIPAVLISIAHFSQPENQWSWLPHGWAYPLIVTGIFIIVQQIDSLFVAPRIVGDAVGLHPLTVIFSVLFWSLLIGGFLGALLAVPLTASIKVLFRRYIWQKRIQIRTVPAPH